MTQKRILQEKLSEVGHKLKQLQKDAIGDTNSSGKVEISSAQLEEINKFRADHIKIRKDLRNVQHALNKEIENLGAKLKVINIMLIPLVVVLLAIILGVIRSRRASSGYQFND